MSFKQQILNRIGSYGDAREAGEIDIADKKQSGLADAISLILSEREQFKEMAQVAENNKNNAVKYAEKLDAKVEELEKERDEWRKEAQLAQEAAREHKENVEHCKYMAEHYKTDAEQLYEEKRELLTENVPESGFVPMSELERERKHFDLLEKAVIDSDCIDKRTTPVISDVIFKRFHQLRSQRGGE